MSEKLYLRNSFKEKRLFLALKAAPCPPPRPLRGVTPVCVTSQERPAHREIQARGEPWGLPGPGTGWTRQERPLGRGADA